MQIKRKNAYTEEQQYPQSQTTFGLREFYPESTGVEVRVLDSLDVFTPLERTRLYGPFCLDVVVWISTLKIHGFEPQIGHDADGKEYVEF